MKNLFNPIFLLRNGKFGSFCLILKKNLLFFDKFNLYNNTMKVDGKINQNRPDKTDKQTNKQTLSSYI